MSTYLAVDLGAENGRGVLVTLRDGRVAAEEIHRFVNSPVQLGGTLYWDFPLQFAEVLEALRKCSARQICPAGIGVDTWGVDFGLLGPDGQLLANPVHYRDSRTDNIYEYSNAIMSTEEIFAATSCEPWAISSLFQLLAMKKNGSQILATAETFLNMPDLFNYFLTGVKASERSIASTSNLMAIDGRWCREVIERFGLPDVFCELVEPGTTLGGLQDSVRKQVDLGEVPVIATCGHDTGAVVAAIPATGDNWAFLSCGTWSILGKLCEDPLITSEALHEGFSNEYSLSGWFSCRNILGLWLVQGLRRKWDTTADPWDYSRMTAEAAEARAAGWIDVADSSLMAPADMEASLLDLFERCGQAKPETRGELVRSVLESLALEYAHSLEVMSELTGRRSDELFMVGGGVANRLLCQLTANACRIRVHAGPAECTAVGNALIQAVALGDLRGRDEIRQVMRNSFELAAYEPLDSAEWDEKLQRYKELKQLSQSL